MSIATTSREEILSWPPTVDLPTAAQPFGLAQNAAYRAYRAGELPFTCIRVGKHKIRAVTATVWQALGITPDTPTEETENE